MRTPSRDDQDLYDQCVALQATIDEHNQEIANSALLFAMACEREVEQQATIEKQARESSEATLKLGERVQELQATITELTARLAESRANVGLQQATIEELEAENEALREILEQCGVDAGELIALKERDHE